MSLGLAVISQFSPSKLSLLIYTDPGSGALLLQLLSAGGLMLSFYVARASKSLKKIFAKLKSSPETCNKQS